jgi:hypothetical protein
VAHSPASQRLTFHAAFHSTLTDHENRMPVFSSSVVGTIRFESELADLGPWMQSDDSTLELALGSLARHGMLDDTGRRELSWSIANTRFGWMRAAGEGTMVIEANLTQLRRNLDAEYAELVGHPQSS